MGTSIDVTTPPAGSLESAAQAITGLLSVTEDTQPTTDQTEQPEKAQQSPPAPDTGSEEDTPQAETPTPLTHAEIRKLKVKLPDGEQELPEDEVVKGYLRNADYTRKTQELARQRDEELTAVRTQRQQSTEYLAQLKQAIESATPKEPDWNALRTQVSPDEYTAIHARWTTTQSDLKAIAAEQARLRAESERDAVEGFKGYVQQEGQRLAVELPEIADPVKGPALKKELWKFGNEIGFTDQQLNEVVDHRLVLVLHDAYQYRQMKAKATTIENKIEKALATSAPSGGAPVTRADAVEKAKERLYATHSVEDGGRAIAALFAAREKAGRAR